MHPKDLTPHQKELRGLWLSFISTALFAAQFPIFKLGLLGGVSPSVGAFLEAFFTFVFCYATFFKARPLIRITSPVVYAGVCNALGLIFLFESLKLNHPALTGLLTRSYYLYALAIGVLCFRERLTRIEYFAAASTVVGIMVMSSGNAVDTSSISLGVIYGLLSPFFFASQNGFVRVATAHSSDAQILASKKVISMGILAVYAIWSSYSPTGIKFEINAQGFLVVALCTYLSTFLGLKLFYQALRLTTFSMANLMKAVEPVLILGLSLAMFPQPLMPHEALGALIVVASAIIVAVAKLKTTSPLRAAGDKVVS